MVQKYDGGDNLKVGIYHMRLQFWEGWHVFIYNNLGSFTPQNKYYSLKKLDFKKLYIKVKQ